MKARYVPSLIALFSVMLFTNSVYHADEIILWDKNDKLDLADFRGQPDYANPHIVALTASGIMQHTECHEGILLHDVKAYFDKNASWVKDEARTAHHLQHEQIHFDITELYARKLAQALSQETFLCGEEKRFNEFVDNLLAGWEKEQIDYDVSTKYSNEEEEQKAWEYRIALELTLHNH